MKKNILRFININRFTGLQIENDEPEFTFMDGSLHPEAQLKNLKEYMESVGDGDGGEVSYLATNSPYIVAEINTYIMLLKNQSDEALNIMGLEEELNLKIEVYNLEKQKQHELIEDENVNDVSHGIAERFDSLLNVLYEK